MLVRLPQVPVARDFSTWIVVSIYCFKHVFTLLEDDRVCRMARARVHACVCVRACVCACVHVCACKYM